MPQGGWIGVDLDGTLAHYDGWSDGQIGGPIPAMVARVKAWLAQGQTVKIVTARVWVGPNGYQAKDAEESRARIQNWCQQHLGQRLEVTCQKNYAMIQLWDDRCVQIEPNTGRTMIEAQDAVYRENLAEREREIEQLRAGLVFHYPYPNEAQIAAKWNLHEDEAKPRGLTWLHERQNWETEVKRLRATVDAMEQTLLGNILAEHDVVYEMKWVQDRIEIEKQIALFPDSKRETLDRFVAGASEMTVAELDPIIGAFGDPEGTYVQRFHAGREAMRRWIDARNPFVKAAQPNEQQMVEQIRSAGFRVNWDDERDMPIRDAD